MLGKVFHIYRAEVADAHVHGDERFLDILEYHAVEQLPAEVQAGRGGADGTLVGGKDGLVVLHVFRCGLFLHPFRNVGLTQAEEGLLEVLIGTVEEETQGAAAGSGVVDDLGHQALILAEVEFVADADLAGGVYDDIPQALLAVELAQEQDHDIGPGLFLLAVQAGGKHLGVVQDKDVSFAEIVDDIFKEAVFDFTGILVQDHQTGLVSPAGRLLGDAVCGEVKVELG